MGWQWNQLDHIQIICTSLQADNHAGTSPLSFHRPDALPASNQQCQSTEGTTVCISWKYSYSLITPGRVLNHYFHFKINWLSFSELLQVRPYLPHYRRIKITNIQIVGLKLFTLIITEICMDDSNFWVTGRPIWHTFEGRNFLFMSQNYRKNDCKTFAKNFCNFLDIKTRQNHTNRWFYSKGQILKKCRLSSVLSPPPQTAAPLPVNSEHTAVTDMNHMDLDCTQTLINCLDPGGT